MSSELFEAKCRDLEEEIKGLKRSHVRIAINAQQFVKKLPKNSPFRQPLLKQLAKEVDPQVFREFFGISSTTYKRIMNQQKDVFFEIKYAMNSAKQMILLKDIEDSKKILEDLIPFKSGRDYRVLKMTRKNVYQMYTDECRKRSCHVLSYSYVWGKILSTWSIWFSKDEIQCPHCLNHETLLKIPEAQRTREQKKDIKKMETHRSKAKEQCLFHLKQKRELVNAKEKTIMIVQDFTQLQCQKDSYQDLIITIYYIDENKELKHSFYHFVAKSKNNNLFVIQTYKQVIGLKELQNVKKLIIWSDGCRRHFKNSSMMVFWCIFHRITKMEVVLEFFESYHGNNACDAASAHLKKRLNVYQRDTRSILKNANEVSEICSTLKNHQGFEGPVNVKGKMEATTFTGISHLYKFILCAINKICAYPSSDDDKKNGKTYSPKKKEFLEIIKLVQRKWYFSAIEENIE